MKVTTIGLDLAKSVFQVHGIADDGIAVIVKRLLRKQMISFFSSCGTVWLAWKPAQWRIIGREPWRRWGTRSS